MDPEYVPDFRQHIEEWSGDIEALRQNPLLSAGRFDTFAKDRGIPISGAITGNSGTLFEQGWLVRDGIDYDDGPLFHPFRLYPFHKILEVCSLRMAPIAPLQHDSVLGLTEKMLTHLPSAEEVAKVARRWNSIVDLAILLEPIYWPDISNHFAIGFRSLEEYRIRLAKYRDRALRFVKDLDLRYWREQHEWLRRDAAFIDENSELYLLLRVAAWDRRKELKGRVSGALWIRHLAEVIRRGLEEIHSDKWLEEDQAFGRWLPGGREREFGSQRPLDDILRSKPYLAYTHGLFTGSSVRWYVEGPTEYYAVAEIIPEPDKFSIELVNLHGIIARDKDNIALKLGAWLQQDKALRRFSIISFDLDLGTSEKTIRKQDKDGNIVGLIAAHDPDFEFANFTVGELVKVAASIDEAHGFSGDPLRNAEWSNINGGHLFEQRYRATSTRGASTLKGEEWGRALARYAFEHPRRSDDQTERPFVGEIRAALHSWESNYDYHKEHYEFDAKTLKLVRKAKKGEPKDPPHKQTPS